MVTKIISIIYKLFLWVILPISIIVVALFGLVFLLDKGGQEILNNQDQAIKVVRIITQLMKVLIFGVSIVVILSAIKFVVEKSKFISMNVSSRLIALGVIAIVYPQVLFNAYLFIQRFLFSIFSLDYTSQETQIQEDNGRIEEKEQLSLDGLGAIDNMFSEILIDYLKALRLIFDEFNVVRFVEGLMYWVVFVKIIDIVSRSGNGGAVPAVSAAAKFLTPLRRNVIMFAVVFFFSIFLCISALVAIPWLEQGEVPSPIKKEQLLARLHAIAIKDDSLNVQFPKKLIIEDEPYKKLLVFANRNKSDSLLKPTTNVDIIVKRRTWDRGIDMLNSDINSFMQKKTEFLAKWDRLKKDVLTEQNKIIAEAESEYDRMMLLSMSPQERSLYFEDVYSIASSKLNRIKDFLYEETSYAKQLESDIKESSIEIQDYIMRTTPILLNDTVTSSNILPIPYTGELATFNYQPDYPSFLLGNYSHTSGVNAGSSWGLFGWVSSWLLKANSIALVFITGMLGFGLLGASISFFVRNPLVSKFGSIPLVELLGVTIRGFVAAIVIYLIVQGGLSIFNSTITKPNAYILFFTCIIGAVYSEDAWKRFYNYFNKSDQGPAQGQK